MYNGKKFIIVIQRQPFVHKEPTFTKGLHLILLDFKEKLNLKHHYSLI